MKYGLNLRFQPSQQKKQLTKAPLHPDLGFNDDDEDDIEREISRQAIKNKALKDVEEQHKKALEENPSVFDYDGVYDEMKEKVVRPVAQDRQERKITKKGNMTEFYFNLSKNVAFGAREGESKRPDQRREESRIRSSEEKPPSKVDSSNLRANQGETSTASQERANTVEAEPLPDSHKQKDTHDSPKQEVGTKGVANQPATDHHKRNQDALAAAKERFLARKMTKSES